MLRDLWRQVLVAADGLGMAVAKDAPYDPDVYRRVYETVLRDRAPDVIALDTILPTAGMSVYDFNVPCADLVPTEDDVDAVIGESEALFRDLAAPAREVERWWVV